jgi:hypothetical protein
MATRAIRVSFVLRLRTESHKRDCSACSKVQAQVLVIARLRQLFPLGLGCLPRMRRARVFVAVVADVGEPRAGTATEKE